MTYSKSILLTAMPFPRLIPPSAQLGALEAYCNEHGIHAESRHLYLKLADWLGLELYTAILSVHTVPREVLYTKLLFPEHFEENKEEFNKILDTKFGEITKKFDIDCETLIEKIAAFNACVTDELIESDYEYYGFSIQINQLLPSLLVARAIKKHRPHAKIVFGGWPASGDRGAGIFKAFPCIDYIISGEGEQSLVDLINATSDDDLDRVGSLIHRRDGEVIFNKRTDFVDMNELPFMSFDGYFKELESCSDEIRIHCEANFTLPLETSRGCWWNRCNFCSSRCVPNKYRVKSPERVRMELEHQTNKHKIVSLFFLDEAMTKNDVSKLFSTISRLDKELLIFSIGRAQRLSTGDIRNMYKAGVTAHEVGIEAFSTSLLEKMNKGATAIENVQIIKQLYEAGIFVSYGLLHSFPYQDEQDYEETLRTISYLKGYPPPVYVSNFELQYGSAVYEDYTSYNIKTITPMNLKKSFLPKEYAKHLVPHLYAFERETGGKSYSRELAEALEKFKVENEKKINQLKGVRSIFFKDGGDYLVIFDHRYANKRKYILDEFERELYLYCDTIKTLDEIFERFEDHPKEKILDALEAFDQHKLIFPDRGEYLSLAVRHRF